MLPDTGDLINYIQDRQDEPDPNIVKCPVCGTPMSYFTGMIDIPAHFYCPICMDAGWDYDVNFNLIKVIKLT